jgi:hypothetical protein
VRDFKPSRNRPLHSRYGWGGMCNIPELRTNAGRYKKGLCIAS